MNESTIVVIRCVSFVNVIPKLSGRMDFGNKCMDAHSDAGELARGCACASSALVLLPRSKSPL